MYEELFCKRLTELRLEKGVSARDMSLSLGQSESYINRIENQKMLPSMTVFFYICEYFEISPHDFFQTENRLSKELIDTMKKIQSLEPHKQKHLVDLINDL